MAITSKTVKVYRCERCGHKWTPYSDDVRICPKCKSARWDTPKNGSKQ